MRPIRALNLMECGRFFPVDSVMLGLRAEIAFALSLRCFCARGGNLCADEGLRAFTDTRSSFPSSCFPDFTSNHFNDANAAG